MRVRRNLINTLGFLGIILILMPILTMWPRIANAEATLSVGSGRQATVTHLPDGGSGVHVELPATAKIPDFLRGALGAASFETGHKVVVPSLDARVMALTRPQEGAVQQLALLLDGQLSDLIDGRHRLSFLRLPGSLQRSIRSTKALTALFASGKAQNHTVIPAVIEAATHLSTALNEMAGYSKDGKLSKHLLDKYPIIQYMHAFVAILAGGTFPKNSG